MKVKTFSNSILASLLLESFISRLKTDETRACKAVYLHVLPTNEAAIKFYEQMNFRFHRTLWNYYNINGTKRNGYCYVSYINGGEAPWSFLYPLLEENFIKIVLKDIQYNLTYSFDHKCQFLPQF